MISNLTNQVLITWQLSLLESFPFLVNYPNQLQIQVTCIKFFSKNINFEKWEKLKLLGTFLFFTSSQIIAGWKPS